MIALNGIEAVFEEFPNGELKLETTLSEIRKLISSKL